MFGPNGISDVTQWAKSPNKQSVEQRYNVILPF